jgi:hypothetical protein
MLPFLDTIRRLLSGPANERDRHCIALGRHEARTVRARTYDDLRDAEFQVFSQSGEDGIIQYLLGKVPIENPVFVEFGVQDYSESNTRFLLCKDEWRGLIIDGGRTHQRFVAARGLDWRYDITALSAFITRENIDDLIRGAGISGDIGLLSVDLDGNDYWVLEAIGCVSPRILVVEYNSHFGPDHAITIPYRSDFTRAAAHHSLMYFGASLPALCHLAERKGYAFVGSNTAGFNAFFVRRDLVGGLKERTAKEGWVENRIRESRDERGRFTLVGDHASRLRLIADLDVVEVPSGRTRRIGDLFGLGPK